MHEINFTIKGCQICKTDQFQVISMRYGLRFSCKNGHETWLDPGKVIKVRIINEESG